MDKYSMANVELLHGGDALDCKPNKIDDDPDWKIDSEEVKRIHKEALKIFNQITGDKDMKEETVNHPQHYKRENSMECIDEMILVFGKEAVKHFCLCNAWKYRYRAADKNGREDIAKSDWYMNKYKELSNEETKSYSITTSNNPQILTIGGSAPCINEYIKTTPSTIPLSKYDQLDCVPTSYTTTGVVINS